MDRPRTNRKAAGHRMQRRGHTAAAAASATATTTSTATARSRQGRLQRQVNPSQQTRQAETRKRSYPEETDDSEPDSESSTPSKRQKCTRRRTRAASPHLSNRKRTQKESTQAQAPTKEAARQCNSRPGESRQMSLLLDRTVKAEQDLADAKALLREVKDQLKTSEEARSKAEAKAASNANEELFKDMMRTFKDLIEKSWSCTVCSEVIVSCHTLQCGHSYCEECIYTWIDKEPTCPICRKKIRLPIYLNTQAEEYIKSVVESFFSEETKNDRKTLIEERKAAKVAREGRTSLHPALAMPASEDDDDYDSFDTTRARAYSDREDDYYSHGSHSPRSASDFSEEDSDDNSDSSRSSDSSDSSDRSSSRHANAPSSMSPRSSDDDEEEWDSNPGRPFFTERLYITLH